MGEGMKHVDVIERLQRIRNFYRDTIEDYTAVEAVDMAISALEKDKWIPVSERLPKCEQEVLICTKEKTYIHEKSGLEWCVNPIVTPAIYEDGTMLEVNSKWHWEDCDWAGWDEEEDCGIIPEGWWENRQFNPDGEYNHANDVEVIAWQPLPKPYTEEEV
jgi:hypothetical protein